MKGCIYHAIDWDKWALWGECRLVVPKLVTAVVVKYPTILRGSNVNAESPSL